MQYVKGRPLPSIDNMEISVSSITRHLYVYDHTTGELCAAINNDVAHRPVIGGWHREIIREILWLKSRLNSTYANRPPTDGLKQIAEIYQNLKFLHAILNHAQFHGVLGQ